MNQKPQNYPGFWYTWNAVILKYIISYVVYLIVEVVLLVDQVMKTAEKTGLSPQTVLRDRTEIEGLLQSTLTQMLQYTVYIEGAAALLVILLLGWMFYRDHKKEQAAGVVRRAEPLWKYIGVLLLSAALALGFNNLIILGNLQETSAAYEKTMELMYSVPFAVQILVMGFAMPIAEEFAYRGMVFRRLRGTISFAMASIFTSLIFALSHGNLVQGLYSFALGVVFCYLYEKYGSVKAPIAAHIAANLLSIIGTKYQWFDWLFAQPVRVGTVTVLCAFIASSVYVWIQKFDASADEKVRS